MTIADITIEDKNVISMTFEGIEPDIKKNISQNGLQRDSVLIKNTYSYTLEIVSLDKKKFEELFAALKSKSDTYSQVTIDMYSIIRAEMPDFSLLDNTAINFEFDISGMHSVNKGAYYNVTIPLQFIEYF